MVPFSTTAAIVASANGKALASSCILCPDMETKADARRCFLEIGTETEMELERVKTYQKTLGVWALQTSSL